MRAVIIGNGAIENYEYIQSFIKNNDYIICADGGANHINKLGIKADVLIGDFDSINPKLKQHTKIIQYPEKKNFTDGELCMQYAIENNFEEMLLLGMTGTRTDHTINNIMLLFQCEKSCLINEYCEIYPITDKLIVKEKKNKTLSIIPLGGDIEGITTNGLEYPLNNETLYFGKARGNSNVVISDYAEITATKGRGIVIINNGE